QDHRTRRQGRPATDPFAHRLPHRAGIIGARGSATRTMKLADFSTVAAVALGAMTRNKLRTGLAMLGIMIGIAAFISTVAIGEGGSNRIREQLQNLGDNFVWVEAGSRNFQGVRTGSGNNTSLTMRDARAIQQSIPLIKAVSPQVDARIQVIYGNTNWNTVYRGVTPEFLGIR